MDQRAFMLNVAGWPNTLSYLPRIYLKNYSTRTRGLPEFAQLIHEDGKWGFVPESQAMEIEVEKVKWGGPELIDEIIKAGWIVD